jgi:hypothetical protein
MKAVRLFSVLLAVALVAVAFSPVAGKPAAALGSTTVATTSPVQSFLSAASGSPLLAPLSAAAPFMTIRVESVASATSSYGCTLVSQSPKDYTKMQSRQYFDAKWVVQNTGQRVWYASAIPFKYIGGAKMQTRGSVFDLPGNIGRGQKVALSVDMTAPKAKGGYSTLWGLYSGNQAFCRVTLTIAVTR